MEVQEHTADPQQQDSQDWEWVEETEYIVLDFGGSNLDASDMEHLTIKGYSLVGLETGTPYFKCGAHTFKGCFEENAFTEDLIFNMKVREDVEEGMEDTEENNTDALELLAITTKHVIFDPVELVRNELMTPVDIDVHVENTQPQQLDEVASKTLARGSSQSIWKAARQAAGMSTVAKRNRVIGTNTVVNKPSASGVAKNATAGPQRGATTGTSAPGSAAASSGAREDIPMELD